MVICLERGADLHMAQLMPLPLTVSCFSKIQIGLTFLVPAYLGSPGQRAVRRVCVCVCNYDTIFYRWSYYCSETMHVERPACCHDATCCSSSLASFKHALKIHLFSILSLTLILFFSVFVYYFYLFIHF